MKTPFIALILGLCWAQSPPQRLDMLVRDDFFAGLRGDATRLNRAMNKCEDILAQEPNNAAALVWHGAGLFFRSGEAFRRGDAITGLEMNRCGLKEMADAVALQPESLETRIPRAAMLIGSAPYLDDEIARPLLELAIGDDEKALGP